MAYLPSTASIGPNSLQAPSACGVAASDARIAEIARQAALGRLAAYLTVPPVSSFDSPTLAGNAAQILEQSKVARSSILSPAAPVPNQHEERVNLRDLVNDAPEVVSLNGRAAELVCGGGGRLPEPPPAPQMVMPQPAPSVVQFSRRGESPRPNAPVFYVNEPHTDTWLQPGGLQMQNLGTRHMGYSGYAPPWGDAGLLDIAPEGGWFKALMILGGVVLVGAAVTGGVKRSRKRRYAR